MIHADKACFSKQRDINYFQKAFYSSYVLIAFIIFSPFKPIAYFAPLLFLFSIIVRFPCNIILKRFLACLLIAGIIISFYGVIYPQIILQNALLTLITYSSYIPLIVIPSRLLVNEILFQKILTFNQKLLLLEGTIGIVQAVYGFLKNRSFSGSNGDYVEGTIHIALEADRAFANPMFAVNITFLCLLALVAVVKFRYKSYPLIIGLLSLILASVVHVFLFLILAILLISFLNGTHLLKNPKFLIKFLIIIFFIISTAVYFIGGNIELASDYINNRKHNQKDIITNAAFFVIPDEYPAMPYIGLGPGQFSSRASLIASGRYFGGFNNPKPLPLLTPKTSAPMEKFLMPIWASSVKITNFGSTQQPFYSWLSVYSEFGLLGSFMVISIAAFLLSKAILCKTSKQNKLYNFAFQVGLVFLLFLGGQENYWEVPQAIFLGLIMLKLLHANIFYIDTYNMTLHD